MLKTVKNNVKRKKKGFTLIELIIVLAIMAILAAIAIPGFNSIRESSRKKADQQSCETIKRAVMILVADGTVKSTGEFTLTNGSSIDYGTGFTEAGEKDAINGALSEVNEPSASDGDEYTVNVTSAGVSVKTETDGVVATF